MKFYISILLFVPQTILTLCCGQSASQVDKSKLRDKNSSVAVGDTVKEPSNSLWIVFQDKNNDYWFGSNGQGVFRYNGETIIQFTTKDGLNNDSIRQIQEDKSGNIYFGTVGGISKFDGQTFTTLSVTDTNSSDKAWLSEADDLWFSGGQDAGVVYRFDGISLHCLKFPKTKPGEEFISNFPRSKYPHMTYSPYDVYSIFKDSKGNIWFGTSSLGVCRYDGKSFTWFSENGLADSPVRSIIEDKNGNFWFGSSSQALYRYDGKSFTNFRKEKGIGNSKGSREDLPVSYNSIIEDNNGELWIATYQAGVWRYDGENVTHYPVNEGDKTINLISIYRDKQGVFWLGTQDAGAYKFNGTAFKRFKL